MQLDAVEPGRLRANGRVGEQTRQHLRQVPDLRTIHVGDALAIAELQRFQLTKRQRAGKIPFAHGAEASANLGVGEDRLAKRSAVVVGDLQEAFEEFLRFGAAANRKEIDQLN